MNRKNPLSKVAPICLALALMPLAPQALAAETPTEPVSIAVNADTREIVLSPRWDYMTRVAASLSISRSGYAQCGGQYTNYAGYAGRLTITLQQYKDNKWTDIKEWSKDFDTDGAKMYTEGWYVDSGYRYRVVATAELMDGDTVVESGSCDSPIQSY